MKAKLSALILGVVLSTLLQAQQRIISAGGAMTELLYALGVGGQLVAVDTSSIYPESASKLPKIGYHRSLSLEGVISLKPTLLLGSAEMGPPNVIQQLQSLNINVQQLPTAVTITALEKRITEVAKLVSKEPQGQALLAGIRANQQQLAKQLKAVKKPLKGVFLVQPGGRSPMVAGTGTSANTLMALAGILNPAATSVKGYRQLASESLIAMAPEVIIVPDHMFKNSSSLATLIAQQPGLIQTPAAKNNRVITVDSSLLVGGVGPRVVEAAQKLAAEAYPDLHSAIVKVP
ncbi:ABC transporter substrate-binding protein [Endozoicomonas sp. SM1973]|uniref:ABC transporter substrate-binding protein n=1 Tax=Spartinivicinus marinus TaxID=2994442 RepID=A0A853I023_9GAMM|nr:ABC transporter substrate-binding protein [Spartinivicinus marinus]MCX4026334.1 ABC transporter substrate-binding protein [Spartinivicinus marinus]NYZ67320.1 ABC transporter substrate-binding protein [Spartinivicinus marinus]